VKGSRVLISPAELSRSIADVYLCRKDFFDANKPLAAKFVAGYLKACEEVVELKREYEARGSQKYMDLLRLAQEIYGANVLPTLEEDAHGLLSDCALVGLPGNIAFFLEKGNLSGFDAFQKSSLDLATSRGYAKVRSGFFPPEFDYNGAPFKGYLVRTEATRQERFRPEVVMEEIKSLTEGGELDERTILSFTINFDPNQTAFSEEQYGAEYQRVVEMAERFGNAVIAIRGHADPTKTLLELVNAGIQKGVLKRAGTAPNYKYSLQGKPLDLTSTPQIALLIEGGAFDGVPEHNPRETMQAALNLSRSRAEAVRDSITAYAKGKGLQIDPTQIQPVGVGIREPFIAKPVNMEEAKQNMRVEFRLIRVPAEATTESDFAF
jgi:outer membrane protein OmpA-like peptidoglycan-associated protein